MGCLRPAMSATPIMTDVVSIGNRAPILEIDWRIQSMTPIAPNRAYPFGPVLSIPKLLVRDIHGGGRTLTRCRAVSATCECADVDGAAARCAMSSRIVFRTMARFTVFGAMTTTNAREFTFVATI